MITFCSVEDSVVGIVLGIINLIRQSFFYGLVCLGDNKLFPRSVTNHSTEYCNSKTFESTHRTLLCIAGIV
jgi:hypothetical protein